MKRLFAILTVLALVAPPALATAGQQTQAERDRQQAQRERERAQREAQQERERAQREIQQERERAQREREQERERQLREREQERDRRNSANTQTVRQNHTLNIDANGEIDVSNIAGDIVVTRASGNSATVEITRTARGPNASELLPLVTTELIERGNRAEIRTRYPDREVLRGRNIRNINVNVSFAIAAPRNARLTIKSISGDISVRDVSGPLILESTSGSVRLINVGRVSAKSISGSVEAVDTRIEGPLEAGTVSGSIRLLRTNVPRVDATTVSGDVTFEDVVSSDLGGQSISGTVTFAGELGRNGRYEMTSHSGSVRVALSGKTGFQVEATSFSGSINTEFPLTLTGQGGRGRNLRATYGDGTATLDLNAFSGSILITKR
jgi:hypothetical protein